MQDRKDRKRKKSLSKNNTQPLKKRRTSKFTSTNTKIDIPLQGISDENSIEDLEKQLTNPQLVVDRIMNTKKNKDYILPIILRTCGEDTHVNNETIFSILKKLLENKFGCLVRVLLSEGDLSLRDIIEAIRNDIDAIVEEKMEIEKRKKLKTISDNENNGDEIQNNKLSDLQDNDHKDSDNINFSNYELSKSHNIKSNNNYNDFYTSVQYNGFFDQKKQQKSFNNNSNGEIVLYPEQNQNSIYTSYYPNINGLFQLNQNQPIQYQPDISIKNNEEKNVYNPFYYTNYNYSGYDNPNGLFFQLNQSQAIVPNALLDSFTLQRFHGFAKGCHTFRDFINNVCDFVLRNMNVAVNEETILVYMLKNGVRIDALNYLNFKALKSDEAMRNYPDYSRIIHRNTLSLNVLNKDGMINFLKPWIHFNLSNEEIFFLLDTTEINLNKKLELYYDTNPLISFKNELSKFSYNLSHR